MSVWEDLTVCVFLDIIDSRKLVGWGKMGFKAQTCWTNLLAFWSVSNRSRILNFGPDRLFFRFSRALNVFAIFQNRKFNVMLANNFVKFWTTAPSWSVPSLTTYRTWEPVEYIDIQQRPVSYCTALLIYRIYHKYSDRQAWANSIEPDEMPQNAASHLGLHWLPLIQQFLDTTSGSELYWFKF